MTVNRIDKISSLILVLAFALAFSIVLGISPSYAQDEPGVVVGEPEAMEDISDEPQDDTEQVMDDASMQDTSSDDMADDVPVDTTGQDASDESDGMVEEDAAEDIDDVAMDESVEEESADSGNAQLITRLLGMKMWQILQDDRMLAEFYEVKLEKNLKMGKVDVQLKVRQALSDQLMDIYEAPMTIAHVKSNGFEVRHPLYPTRRMEFEYLTPPSDPAILAIYERCDCAEPEGDLVHLFVEYRRILMPIGAASGVEDADGDGLFEPYVYEEAFKGGFGILDSDTAIRIKVYFNIIDGKMKPGGQKFALYYLQQISELDKLIVDDQVTTPTSGDLVPILKKFLYYRAMGREEEGWTAFNADIQLYGGHMFPQRGIVGEELRNIKVERLSELMRKAFGASPSR